MYVLDKDILSLWKSFNDYEVKYIMIVGFATNLHGYSRATNDIDLLFY